MTDQFLRLFCHEGKRHSDNHANMRKLLLTVASMAIVLVCSVSTLGQAADNSQQGTQEDRKTPDNAQGEPRKDEDDGRKSKRTVTLRVIVRPSGKAQVVKVLEITPKDLPKEVADDMVKKSIKAIERMKFSPPMKDGRRLSQYVTIKYHFGTEEKENQKK